MQQVNPYAHRDWNEQVLASPHASIFHSTNWLRVLQSSYGYQPYYLASFTGEQLTALLPFVEVNSWITGVRGVSLPFSDYCEPISDGTTSYPEVLEQVLRVARQQQWKFLEVRGGDAWLRDVSPYTFYYRHQLALHQDEADVFSRLRSNYRARISKALASDLSVTICHSAEAIEEYYRLHCLTRKRQGVPPQPACFFRHIHAHIIAQHFGFVVLVSYEGRNIAGAVFFSFGHCAMYKFGASDTLHQSLFPNYLLFWHAIQWFCHHGYTELCFGRSDPANTGLIQFKDGWGAQKSRIHYYRYDLQTGDFVKKDKNPGEYGRKIWQKMPVAFLKLSGSLLYRHIG